MRTCVRVAGLPLSHLSVLDAAAGLGRRAGVIGERFELAEEVPGEGLPAVGIGWLSART